MGAKFQKISDILLRFETIAAQSEWCQLIQAKMGEMSLRPNLWYTFGERPSVICDSVKSKAAKLRVFRHYVLSGDVIRIYI